MSSTDKLTGILAASAVVGASALVIEKMRSGKESKKEPIPDFLTDKKYQPIIKLIADELADISNESLYKIVRQLEFWTSENLSDSELIELTKRLVKVATWRKRTDFQVPKRRFGKTELQMPIITCGSMRFQHTWAPDNLPITISKKKVIKTPSQENINNIVHNCIKMGINHFETARMYGTSEVQLVHALTTLMERGDIKRSDFILQTKIAVNPSATKEEFIKAVMLSWQNFEKLGHIDLFSFHCISSPYQAEKVLTESGDGLMPCILDMKKEGKIKHIGFSTHGSAEVIMKLVESGKFDYCNIHYHFFGSYHAEGTPDTRGGHGLAAVLKRAKELDMGVFEISPVDKAGHLYNPPATVCRILGPKLNPISFSMIHSWEQGYHTSSVGFARPDDLDECIEAAALYGEEGAVQMVEDAAERLTKHAQEKLGKEWYTKSLLNIPSYYEESSVGVAAGHILWCYNLIHAFGMYEMAHARYKMLEKTNSWNYKVTFEENAKKMANGNPGRRYDGKADLTAALASHIDPECALARIKETTELLKKATGKLSADKKLKFGWNDAYDLRPWHEYPDTSRASVLSVILQNVSGGWLGAGGGPTKDDYDFASRLRCQIRDG